MGRHTPGPWKWFTSCQGGTFLRGNMNGESFDTVLDTPNDVYSGDRALIEISPFLLRDLKSAREYLKDFNETDIVEGLPDFLEHINQTIARAEGRE